MRMKSGEESHIRDRRPSRTPHASSVMVEIDFKYIKYNDHFDRFVLFWRLTLKYIIIFTLLSD